MQIKMFVIKPTDHNGFLAAVLLVVAVTGIEFSVGVFKVLRHVCRPTPLETCHFLLASQGSASPAAAILFTSDIRRHAS